MGMVLSKRINFYKKKIEIYKMTNKPDVLLAAEQIRFIEKNYMFKHSI